MSVMTAGKAAGPAGTVIPLRPLRGGADRRLRAVVPRAARPRAGVSRAAVSQAAVPRVGGPRAGVPLAREVRPAGAQQAQRVQRARPVRLTRRGRIVVAALIAVAVLLAAMPLWLAVAARAQSTSGASPAGAVYRNLTPVVVHPGESLWSIALRAEPNADPRIVVHQIMELNALSGTGIVPGERLWVPRG